MPWRKLGFVISAVLLLAAFTPALAQDMQRCFAAADKVKDGQRWMDMATSVK